MSAPRLRLVISPRAQRDFRSIRLYGLREWGKERADAYQTALTHGFERLRDYPQIGKAREDLKTGLRVWPIEHHVLYYRIKADAIEIARILHERADPARHQFR
jgi:toxin ParE1/3/4